MVQDCYLVHAGGADRLPHDLDRRGPRAGPQRRSASSTCPRSASGTAPTALWLWARTHPAATGRLVLDGPPNPTLDEPDAGEARTAAAESAFDAFADRLRGRPGLPARRRPAGRRRRTGRPSARTADHLDGRAPAHRGHDRHRAPRRARRARRLARPGPGPRPGERRQPGRPARAPHAAARPRAAGSTWRWRPPATTCGGG